MPESEIDLSALFSVDRWFSLLVCVGGLFGSRRSVLFFHARTRWRLYALSHAHAPTLRPTHAVGRVARFYGRNIHTRGTYIVVTRTHQRTRTHRHTHRQFPHTRGTYIVVTHSHTHIYPIRVKKHFNKSPAQSHGIVAPRSKPTPRKNPYPYLYVVRIFLLPERK